MRWLVGILLIIAALMKLLELCFSPSTALAKSVFNLTLSPLLLPIQIGGEFGLGLAVLLGIYWRQLRWLLSVIFSGFACYTLYLALRGAASCGCFGIVSINPWWTFFIDIAVVAGLAIEGKTQRQSFPVAEASVPLLPSGLLLTGVAAISIGITSVLAWQANPQPANSQQLFQTVGDLIILEPEVWVGKEFPLAESINIDVSTGKWVVILHRHDCSKCQEAIPQYVQLATTNLDFGIAIVEVPPHSNRREQFEHCLCGRLTDDLEWFVQTPVEIQLTDGIVTNASADLPLLIEPLFLGESRNANSFCQAVRLEVHPGK